MSYKRRKSSVVSVGNVKIGGDNPISIQSMTNTDTRDAAATIAQIKRLEEVGCDIVRIAVPDMEAAKNIGIIKKGVNIPVIADIHFDHRLALEAIDQGIDGVRINPGNIGSIEKVKMVVEKCKEKNLKIRIGVNGGSLEKNLLQKYGSATPEALVESALGHVKILEDLDFRNIVISLKSSDIHKTLEAYELISKKVDYPLHIGITESGSVKKGTIKSSIGVGALLLKGIGDTIRISLTGDPCEEVEVGKEILRSLGLLNDKIKMTNTDTRDAAATIAQIKRLEEVGCDIVRIAVPDMEAAKNIGIIKKGVNIPVIADIHFDHRLALEAIDQGIDGVRINPGNIGSIEKVKMVVEKCKEKNLKIRIGVNGGSLEKNLLQKYGSATPEALVESALGHVKILEDLDFRNIVISLKSSDIHKTLEAYELISKKVDYPLHIGITESGSVKKGTIKSSIGVGALLLKGIGDTIRISLTGDPCEEVEVGKEILRSLGLLNDKIKVVSCPTCGRCNIDLISVVTEVEEKIKHMDKDITVAIMGCAVNGPGEAREADIGIAGGKGEGLLFKKGEIIRKIQGSLLVDELLDEIDRY